LFVFFVIFCVLLWPVHLWLRLAALRLRSAMSENSSSLAKFLPARNDKEYMETHFDSLFLCDLWRSFAANSFLVAVCRAASWRLGVEFFLVAALRALAL
jgi:hypothetical protein